MTTMIPRQQMIDAAKAPVLTFNEKNWEAVRASISPDFVYEEVATNRKVQGVDQVLPLWQGWATAFPDAKATFHREHLSDDSVVFEVSWRAARRYRVTGASAGSGMGAGCRYTATECCLPSSTSWIPPFGDCCPSTVTSAAPPVAPFLLCTVMT